MQKIDIVRKWYAENESAVCRLEMSNNNFPKSKKKAITKRNKLLQTWVEKPSKSNHDDYKSYRNNVCAIIREAKKQDNIRKFGINPTARALYRKLKSHKNLDQQPHELPDLEKLNDFFNCWVNIVIWLPQNSVSFGVL